MRANLTIRKIFLPAITVVIFLFPVFSSVFAQGNQTVTNGQPTVAVNFPGTTCIYTWKNSNPAIGLPASGTGNISSFTATNNGSATITGTITATPLSGGYAYIANLGNNNVAVINTATDAVVANITAGSAPTGVSVSPDNSKVYISNYNSNNVSVVSTATNQVIKTITVGVNPQGIVVSPDGSKVYVANNTTNDVSVIDASSGMLIKAIAVGLSPRGICVSPDGSKVYVANNTTSTVSVINTATNVVTATIPVGANPAGIAASPDGNFVYTANQSSNNVSAINTATNQVVKTIPVGTNPFGLTVNSDGSRVYVANMGSNSVSVINTSATTVTSITVGLSPNGTSISQDGSLLYVANAFDGSISVIQTATDNVISTLKLGTVPEPFGNFIAAGVPCAPGQVSFTISVAATAGPPVITATVPSGNISACFGSASENPDIEQFDVSGSGLADNITVTAPANFEVSLTPSSGYGSSVTINQSGGVVGNTIVYVNSAAGAPSGNISGPVVLSSPGATSQNVTVSGIINAVPSVDPVNSQIRANGEATIPVDFTGTGNTFNWVNNTPEIGLGTIGSGNIGSFTAVGTGSKAIIATITVTPGTIIPQYAYIANQTDGTVSVIDTKTHSVVTVIPVGSGPSRVSVSSDGSRVYVANFGSNSVSVISTATNKVISTIAAGAEPFGVAVSPDGSLLYVTNESTASVSVINTKTNLITATINVGQYPYCVSLSPDGSRAYAVNNHDNTVSVINTGNNSVIATIPVGSGPIGLSVSPDGTRVYVVNSNLNSRGTLSVISTETNKVILTIPVGSNPYGIAVSPDGGTAYVTNSGASGSVSAINTATGIVEANIATLPGGFPTGISVSPDGSSIYVVNFLKNSVSVISTATNQSIATVAVGSGPLSFGNFINGIRGCNGTPYSFTIEVDPSAPGGNGSITSTGSLAPLQTIYGTPSSSTSFNVSGDNVSAGILVMPPPGFEVSTDNITFSSTVTIGSAGTIASTPVYIRLAATTPVGNTYSGNIVLSSAGASAGLVMPNSTVTPALVTITADNKSKNYGDVNPVLTASYSGFVNNEGIAQITVQPQIITLANTLSLPGLYPIKASGAMADNYTFSYIDGVLTISLKTLSIIIPNAFTPNNDGINDTWDIKYLDSYPNNTVDIFNRYGEKVYSSIGYAIAWDGTYNGNNVPAGTYYYIINPKNGYKVVAGYVVLIR